MENSKINKEELQILAVAYIAISDKWTDEKTPIVGGNTFYCKDEILKGLEKMILANNS